MKAAVCRYTHRSTLLLDEVGELEPRTQALLFRFLKTGDVRIISATNRELLPRASAQAFLVDLYYRLNVVLDATSVVRRRPRLSRMMSRRSRVLTRMHSRVRTMIE